MPGLTGNVVQRQAGIENVFDENYVAVGKRLVHILGDAHFAELIQAAWPVFSQWGVFGAIAGYLNVKSKVASRETWRARSLRRFAAPLQNANKDNRLPLKVTRDVGRKFGHALGDLFAGQEYFKVGHGEKLYTRVGGEAEKQINRHKKRRATQLRASQHIPKARLSSVGVSTDAICTCRSGNRARRNSAVSAADLPIRHGSRDRTIRLILF